MCVTSFLAILCPCRPALPLPHISVTQEPRGRILAKLRAVSKASTLRLMQTSLESLGVNSAARHWRGVQQEGAWSSVRYRRLICKGSFDGQRQRISLHLAASHPLYHRQLTLALGTCKTLEVWSQNNTPHHIICLFISLLPLHLLLSSRPLFAFLPAHLFLLPSALTTFKRGFDLLQKAPSSRRTDCNALAEPY